MALGAERPGDGRRARGGAEARRRARAARLSARAVLRPGGVAAGRSVKGPGGLHLGDGGADRSLSVGRRSAAAARQHAVDADVQLRAGRPAARRQALRPGDPAQSAAHPSRSRGRASLLDPRGRERPAPAATDSRARSRCSVSRPDSGHMLHMPGHLYYRLGRYAEARRAFLESMAFDEAYMRRERMHPINDWNYVHNLDYLVATAAESGRYDEGLQYAERLRDVQADARRVGLVRHRLHHVRRAHRGGAAADALRRAGTRRADTMEAASRLADGRQSAAARLLRRRARRTRWAWRPRRTGASKKRRCGSASCRRCSAPLASRARPVRRRLVLPPRAARAAGQRARAGRHGRERARRPRSRADDPARGRRASMLGSPDSLVLVASAFRRKS